MKTRDTDSSLYSPEAVERDKVRCLDVSGHDSVHYLESCTMSQECVGHIKVHCEVQVRRKTATVSEDDLLPRGKLSNNAAAEGRKDGRNLQLHVLEEAATGCGRTGTRPNSYLVIVWRINTHNEQGLISTSAAESDQNNSRSTGRNATIPSPRRRLQSYSV